MAAWCTVPHAAPPPWWIRLKNVRSPMPTLRAISISSLLSMVNVTMPSTSAGARPASSRAAFTASVAMRISVRPESLENSVAPMPATAAFPASEPFLPTCQLESDGSDHVVAHAVGAPDLDLDVAVGPGAHPARHAHGVARVVGRPEADGDLLEHGVGPGPVGDETPDPAVGREDVHEDVLRATLAGQLGVVMDVLVV